MSESVSGFFMTKKSSMAIKPEGGWEGKALMALRKELFFAASLIKTRKRENKKCIADRVNQTGLVIYFKERGILMSIYSTTVRFIKPYRNPVYKCNGSR